VVAPEAAAVLVAEAPGARRQSAVVAAAEGRLWWQRQRRRYCCWLACAGGLGVALRRRGSRTASCTAWIKYTAAFVRIYMFNIAG